MPTPPRSHLTPITLLAVLAASLLTTAARAAARSDDGVAKEPLSEPAKVKRPPMDYGRFLSYSTARLATTRPAGTPPGKAVVPTIAIPNNMEVLATKGINIKLGKSADATACFDTDTLRYAVGWTGGFLDLSRTHMTLPKGDAPATIVGPIAFTTHNGPGAVARASADLADPRPRRVGPLPRDAAHYRGMYLHGDRVVLSYTAGDVEVLDAPWAVTIAGRTAFTRTIRIEKSAAPVTLLLADVDAPDARPTPVADGIAAIAAGDGAVTAAALVGAPAAVTLRANAGRLQLEVAPHDAPAIFTVALWHGPAADLPKLPDLAKAAAAESATDPALWCKGGPPQWPTPIVTRGVVAADTAPYVVDLLTLPEQNPWNAWLRLTAHDFLSAGRVAVCTWSGDVWMASGVDAKLDKLTWRRFASGLYETLGLRVVDDTVYVLGRDQITRLHDLNGDGEADFYENFNNDALALPGYHAFALDLQTDRAGNFYYSRCGNQSKIGDPQQGVVLKVSKDGRTVETIASGLRAANGAGMGPNDQYTNADNQGYWTPACRINWVTKGGFYGHCYDPRFHKPADLAGHKLPTTFDPPLCWIPLAIDPSAGGQAWNTTDKWGPFKDRMVHTSYGQCTLMGVLHEIVDGVPQGGVFTFPINFPSGIMRPRFHPEDGQLYLSGLRGWQTRAGHDGVLARVRYTGKPLQVPLDLHVGPGTIAITFTCALDPDSAADPDAWGIEQWNYKWSADYGSPDYSVVNPGKKGRDAVEVTAVRLSADKRTATLTVPALRPVMQMAITYKIKSAAGTPVVGPIYNTINRLPAAR